MIKEIIKERWNNSTVLLGFRLQLEDSTTTAIVIAVTAEEKKKDNPQTSTTIIATAIVAKVKVRTIITTDAQ